MIREESSSPYKELVHTQPILTRLFHWIQFFSLTILSFTGFYIHIPSWLNISMKVNTLWHFIAAYIFLANFIAYVYYYIVSKYYHTVIFKLKDIKHLFSFFLYVFFIKNDHPYYGKYNPGQKIVYTLWAFLTIFMAVTGFILYYPTQLQFMSFFLGELAIIRLFHFVGAVMFYVTIPLHIYLVFTEDPTKLQAMFTGYVKR